MSEKRIGILVGSEWSWPPAFLREVNRRNAGVSAEMIKLGGTRLDSPCPYDVLVDRMSQEIPYYRLFLRHAALTGAAIINDPLRTGANDRFSDASMVAQMGFRQPRVVALPCHSYPEGIIDDSLRNLQYPIPWDDHIAYLRGFPIILRPVRNNAPQRIAVLESYEDLWQTYNKTGAEPMLLQECRSWDRCVRCLCIGPDRIMPIPYAPGWPWPIRYQEHVPYLTPDEQTLVIESAAWINQALGYTVNQIDFAFREGALYVVDVTNPVPDFDVNILTPYFFDWAVKALADLTIEYALQPRPALHDLLNMRLKERATATMVRRRTLRRGQMPDPGESRNGAPSLAHDEGERPGMR